MMAQGLRCVPGTRTQFPWHAFLTSSQRHSAALMPNQFAPARKSSYKRLIEGSTMKKDVQETFERALAGFEKRQEAVRRSQKTNRPQRGTPLLLPPGAAFRRSRRAAG